jgi:hypothetical protein
LVLSIIDVESHESTHDGHPKHLAGLGDGGSREAVQSLAILNELGYAACLFKPLVSVLEVYSFSLVDLKAYLKIPDPRITNTSANVSAVDDWP